MSGIAIPGPFEVLTSVDPLFVEDSGESSTIVPCVAGRPTRVFRSDSSVEDGRRGVLAARMQAAGCETFFEGSRTAFANVARFFFFAIPRDELRDVRFCAITPIYAHEGATRQVVIPGPGENRAFAAIDYSITVVEDGAEIASRSERMLQREFEENENSAGTDSELRLLRQSVRPDLHFFPSGSTDVVIRVALIIQVSATGSANRSSIGGTISNNAQGSTGVAEASLSLFVRRAVQLDVNALLRTRHPLDVPSEYLERLRPIGIVARPRSDGE